MAVCFAVNESLRRALACCADSRRDGIARTRFRSELSQQCVRKSVTTRMEERHGKGGTRITQLRVQGLLPRRPAKMCDTMTSKRAHALAHPHEHYSVCRDVKRQDGDPNFWVLENYGPPPPRYFPVCRTLQRLRSTWNCP